MGTLYVLLWKDLMIAKRQKISTIYRMVSPLLLMLFAIYIRSRQSPDALSDSIKPKEGNIRDDNTTASHCILYTPNSNLAGTLMDEVGRQLGLTRLTAMPQRFPCIGYYPYSSYSEIFGLLQTFSENEVAVCIIFEDLDGDYWSSRKPDGLTYTIQIDGKFNTRSFTSTDKKNPPDHQHNIYGDVYEDFIRTIQKAIDTSYIKVRTRKKEPQKSYVHEFPHLRTGDTARWNDKMTSYILYSYNMMLSTINLFTHIMARMCCERAAGIQELIKMNGVSRTTMSIAYFISSLPPALSFSIGCTILFKISDMPIIEYTSGVYIFLALALYAVSLLSFAMVCSYVVNNSRFVTGIAVFIFIGTILMIKYVLLNPPKNMAVILLSGMMLHVPLLWIIREIFTYEFLRKPLTYSDLTSKLNTQGSVLLAYLCLTLQSLMYFALAWYLSYVRQGHYGNSLPWNFLCKKKVNERVIATYREVPEERDNRYFEEPPTSKQVGIQIMNVSKYYPKPALSDVSLDVYKGEITILLGHNGAGKTTLMSIITGMTGASEGKVLVNGMETHSNSLQVRKQIGLCTQHNLFIDYLDVIEHVMFFNMLKGKSTEPRADSQELLKKLGIDKKEFAMPEELSGGMKRRLQLACALAGGSDVLVLDEPTSGLDIETRRELWNLLLSLRGERTVLLSTHFMEEADALGDRVAALHTGHLRCHATPMYLKKAMGGGYRLSLITSGKPNEAEITAMVMKYVSGATVRDELMNTITYNLPSAATSQFPELFAALETNRESLEIDTIGVGVSTMEEVFLFLCSDSESFIKDETDTVVPASEYGKIKGKELYMRQAIVLFKRHIHFLRECLITFPVLQIIVPALLLYFFSRYCNNTKYSTESRRKPGILMDLNMQKPLSRRALYITAFRGAANLALNLISNIVVPQFLVASRRAISLHSRPLDDPDELNLPPDNGAKSIMDLVLWATLICYVILFTSQYYNALPSREGASGARHLHVMAGCPAVLHWLCTLIFHTALTLLTVVPITIICAYVCDTDNTFRNARFLFIVGLILILGNIAFFSLMYLLVITFSKKTSSGLGIALIIWSGMMAITKVLGSMLTVKYHPLEYAFLIITNVLPSFAMTVAIGQATYVARLNTLCQLHNNLCPKLLLVDKGFDDEKCCAGESHEYISFEEFAPGMQIVIMLLQGIIYMTLVIFIQMGYFNCFCDRIFNRNFKAKPVIHVDELVAAEAMHLDQEIKLYEQQIINHNKAVLVSNLHKTYAGICHKHHAVKGISFSVNKGECFGLLGLNGAGKSTTFKMMTAEVCPTSGRIFANGVFLHKQKKELLSKIGYCPQFLGIDDFQTGNDNLRTMLTIRGLDDIDIDKEIKAWISIVGLQRFANMRASHYSGGYKRRLAAAAALCSGAPLSLLDEPTAGVDVGARRLVHAALRKSLSLGDSIIITSHSMDEMEALCTRIAIVAAGNIRALGTSAELRTKYAQGYSLIFKVKQDRDSGGKSPLQAFKVAVNVKFNCVLKDEHMTMLHYHINNTMVYSQIFSRVEDLRFLFPHVIEDYSVNETTLEEVFLHLAKEHLMEQKAAKAAASEATRNKGKSEQSGVNSKV